MALVQQELNKMEYRPIKYKNISDMYLISEYGDIYSKYYYKILKPKKDKDGYLSIALVSNDGLRHMHRIATLVINTYIGSYPKNLLDPTVNHIDGNILNNHYSNLEWMERSTNSAIRLHTSKGERNGSAKLQAQDVRNICAMLIKTDKTLKEIANIYGVTKSTIASIKNRKTWTEVTQYYSLLPKCRLLTRDIQTQRVVSINPLLCFQIRHDLTLRSLLGMDVK